MKTMSVCIGSACHVNGSYHVVKELNKMIAEQGLKEELELVGSFCMGKCNEGVAVKCDDVIYSVSEDNIEEIFEKILRGN